MEAAWDRQLDRVHNACNCSFFQRVNDWLEKGFYRVGEFIGTYAPLVCAFVAIGVLLLGLGLLTAEGENDLYKLWIESDSRLIGERQFVKDHWESVIARQQFILAQPKGSDTQVFQEKYIDDYFQLLKGYAQIVYDDPVYGSQGIEEVCARSVESIKPVYGLFRLYGLQGFPCSKVTPMDCFKEGDYNYNLSPSVLSALGRRNVYATRPSFYNTTLEDNLKLASSLDQCTMWAQSRFPEGFMWGGVQRERPDDYSSPIVQIYSMQTVVDLMTPEQMAKKRCVDKCTSQAGCRNQMLNCIDPSAVTGGLPVFNYSCIANATRVYGPQCGASIAADPVQCPVTLQCAQAACLNLSAPLGQCPSYNRTVPPFVCYSCSLQMLQQQALPNQFCAGCLQACGGFAATQPGSACALAVYNCANGLTNQCINRCISAGNDCEARCVTQCTGTATDAEIEAAGKTLRSWESKFIDYMNTNKDAYSVKVDYYAGRTTDDLVEEAGASDGQLVVFGYLFMLILSGVVLFKPDSLRSKVTLGLVGFVLVMVSVLGGMGLSALAGIPFSPTVVQVLPFLAIGLGVQDMFVFSFTWQYRPDLTVTEQIADLHRDAGMRTTLTSTVNAVAFAIGAAIPLPAISQLSAAAALVVVVNWVTVFFAHTALIALNARRVQAGKRDVLCCLNASYPPTSISAAPEHISGINSKCAACVMYTPVRIGVLLLGICVFALGMWGAETIVVGLPLSDIVPKSSYAYGFLKARDEYYGAYKSGIMTGFLNDKFTAIDYGDLQFQKAVIDMELKMDKVFGHDPVTPIYITSIFDRFLRWFNYQLTLPAGTDTLYVVTRMNASSFADPSSASLNLTLYTTSATGVPFTVYCTQCYFVRPALFSTALDIFLNTDGISSLEQIQRNSTNSFLNATLYIPPEIYAFRIIFVQGAITSDEDAVKFIVESRHVTDNAGYPMFPAGFVYDLYEQYVNVNKYLSEQMGYISIGIFFSAFLFLFHPGAVIIMCLVVAIITSEIYGYLYFFNLKMNGVCVINLVFSLAVSVAFTAHIVRLFQLTPGTRRERAQVALSKMVFPISFSAISTFVGVFPLNFAKFPYFVFYFFYQFIVILVLATFNGLFVLPVILSFVGPPVLSTAAKGGGHNEVDLPALEEGEEETT